MPDSTHTRAPLASSSRSAARTSATSVARPVKWEVTGGRPNGVRAPALTRRPARRRCRPPASRAARAPPVRKVLVAQLGEGLVRGRRAVLDLAQVALGVVDAARERAERDAGLAADPARSSPNVAPSVTVSPLRVSMIMTAVAAARHGTPTSLGRRTRGGRLTRMLRQIPLPAPASTAGSNGPRRYRIGRGACGCRVVGSQQNAGKNADHYEPERKSEKRGQGYEDAHLFLRLVTCNE